MRTVVRFLVSNRPDASVLYTELYGIVQDEIVLQSSDRERFRGRSARALISRTHGKMSRRLKQC